MSLPTVTLRRGAALIALVFALTSAATFAAPATAYAWDSASFSGSSE